MKILPLSIRAACGVFLAMGAACSAQDQPATPGVPVIETTTANPLDGPFLGFGAEWDSYNYPQSGVTDADLAMIKGRLEWMKLPLARTMMMAKWCYLGDDKYDWETPNMQMLYRQLEICDQLGITVLLTEWGYNDTWEKTPGITGDDDPKYAEVIGAYMDHLVNVKKFKCIRYFIFVNEPHSEMRKSHPVDAEAVWNCGLSQVAAEFKKRGLTSVKLSGPDNSVPSADLLDERSWLKSTLGGHSAELGAYDLHNYSPIDIMEKGGVKKLFATAWRQVRAADPDKTKPLLDTECGYWVKGPTAASTTSSGKNPLNADWHYGLLMARYAKQAVEGGTEGLSAWMLDDTSQAGQNWGLWNTKKNGWALKPWFYVWALISRSFQAGSNFATADSSPPNVEILAAQLPAKTSPAWSFLIINTGTNATTFRVRVPGGPTMKAARYVYAEHVAAVDKDGFPPPHGKTRGRARFGREPDLPSPKRHRADVRQLTPAARHSPQASLSPRQSFTKTRP